MLTRPGKNKIKADARDVALQHKIYQYQEITPSMAVTTVWMHYSKDLMHLLAWQKLKLLSSA